MNQIKNLAFFSIILLLTLSFIPSYAAVTSVNTDKLFYTLFDTISFSGKEDEGKKQVIVVIRNPSGNYMGNMGDPLSEEDGTFATIPRPIKEFFTSSGTYNATAFSESETESQGISTLLFFDGDTITVGPKFILELKTIGTKIVEQEKTLTFVASITDSSLDDVEFSLEKNVPTGATIDKTSGVFSWTPTSSQGPGGFSFDVVANKGPISDRETITINVKKPIEQPKTEKEIKDEQMEAFQNIIDSKKGTNYYLDRYNNEPAYKDWFDNNFPDITIYEGLGISDPSAPEPEPEPKPSGTVASFVDPNKDPQYYIDRYNNEPSYKDWFDRNFPDMTIHEAVGLDTPETETPKELAPFVDPNKDPQYYIDRYNNEPSYKDWFDGNFPDMTIYQAVGLDEPAVGICGPDTILKDGVCEAVIEPQQSTGGCLIATATYGSELAPQVQQLRELRDTSLLATKSGSGFMTGFNQFYYSFSPVIADWERENPMFKEAVKITITPLLISLSLLNYADMDSEAEVLGYGIGIIFLNIGMYFAAPAIVIWNLRKI